MTFEQYSDKLPRSLSYAIITVSTSRYEKMKEGEQVRDVSGDLAEKIVSETNRVYERRIVPDSKEIISKVLKELLNSSADVIIFIGGTGPTLTDVTIEVVRPFLDKELPGFGELFRKLSYERIGLPAILSRAIAGVSKGKAVYCLPGSPDAVKLALNEIIIKISPLIVYLARRDSDTLKEGADEARKKYII